MSDDHRSPRDRDSRRDDSGRAERRDRSRDRSRDRRRRSRSGDRRDRDRDRKKYSRSRSRSPSEKKKKPKKRSNWDLTPQDVPNIGGPPGTPGAAILGLMGSPIPTATINTQVRQSRKLYVGNIAPSSMNEEALRTFFSRAMAAANPNADQGDAVVSVYINIEKKFAFIEFRTAEEATAAMNLDGIVMNGSPLKVRRPSDYNPGIAAAAGLGVTPAAPTLDLARLGVISTQVGDGPNKIFCGGLPYGLSDAEVKELLSAFGPLRAFHMVRDKDSQMSKGYCFLEYLDPAHTDIAIEGLNNMQIGTKTLTVRRAQQKDGGGAMGGLGMGMGMGLPGMGMGLPGMGMGMPLMGMPGFNAAAQQPATRVLVLTQMLTMAELNNDEEYKDIMEETREECEKYGKVVKILIPRLGPNGAPAPGVGKVFVEFQTKEDAAKARAQIEHRQFDGRTVGAYYLNEDNFAAGALD